MSLSGKHILLGVTGGIAAYKSACLLRDFQKAGAEVRVTMTPSATRFIGTETFAALSRHEVAVDVFNHGGGGNDWTRHIHWGEWADLLVIAPCTANTLAKLVHGMSDNMLTSVALALRCPLLVCPTMDGEMMNHPAVKRNLELASDLGYHLLNPESGYLASGLEGTGRLPDPETILRKAANLLQSTEKSSGNKSHLLAKKKVVVTAGPTREHIDPVRFISNPSSGKMGIAMAEAARDMGGSVKLFHGPVSSDIPEGVDSANFESASDLFELIRKNADADVVIMAAAVSDFRPSGSSSQKIKKQEAEPVLTLTANPDSLEWLGKHKKNGQILIGFAMETENLEKNALQKLEKKNLDWICANDLTTDEAGFQSDSNHLLLFGKDSSGEVTSEVFSGSKRDISREILKRIFTPSESQP